MIDDSGVLPSYTGFLLCMSLADLLNNQTNHFKDEGYR